MAPSPPSSPDGNVVERLPWMVFTEASYCTIGHDDNNNGGAAADFSFHRIPGLPADDNVTCLGAAADGWLALDLTDDVYRRTPLWDSFCHDTGKFADARPDVKHTHAYMLHNPFSGETVPLPELDAIVGDVAAETFQIRKVLMRSSSSSPDEVVTNNLNHNIILCRPGKVTFVLPYFRVFDVEFVGENRLYGITPDEDLLVFHLAEDEDGRPIVTDCKRVIKHHHLADDEEDLFSWMDNADHDGSDDWDDDDDESEYGDEDVEDDGSFNGDVLSDGDDIVKDDEVPHEPKDYINTTRHLVKSPSGGEDELLMVRYQKQVPVPPISRSYTRKVEVLRADIEAGQWVPMITGDVLAQGEALFLSRSFCKSTTSADIIKDGSIYNMDTDDVFDTRSGTCSRPFSLPRQWRSADTKLLTWLFPPQS